MVILQLKKQMLNIVFKSLIIYKNIIEYLKNYIILSFKYSKFKGEKQ